MPNPKAARRLEASALFAISLHCSLTASCSFEHEEIGQSRQQVSSTEHISDIIANNQAAEDAMNLIERVLVGEDTLIEFYEPSAGELMISVAGVAGSEVPDVDGSPEEIFDRYAQGRAMSAAMKSALARRDQVISEGGSPRPAAGASEISEAGGISASSSDDLMGTTTAVSGSCDWTWLRDNVCNTHHNWDWIWETPYWWDGRTISGSGVTLTKGTVCADIGNVTLQVSRSNGAGGTWWVGQGTYRYWYGHGALTCPFLRPCYYKTFSVTYDITDALGDRFHTCGYFEF